MSRCQPMRFNVVVDDKYVTYCQYTHKYKTTNDRQIAAVFQNHDSAKHFRDNYVKKGNVKVAY